eukprot:g1696.t1
MSTSTLNDFNILSTLGSGSYGQVYKVERIVHKHTAATKKTSKKKKNKVYVMKQVQLNQMTKEEQFDAVNECKIMASLSSKYIVKYYDSFIDKTSLNIIMEYCNNGDLQQYLSHAKRKSNTYNINTKTDKFSSNSHGKNVNSNYQNNSLLPENIIWKFLIEMANGLYYLHSQKILHRDMKTANIFLSICDDSGNTQAHCNKFGQHIHNVPSLKIGDLGVAKMLNSTKSYAASVVGTPYYLSPELCANKPYNKQSDVWALDMLNKDMKKRITLKKFFNRKCVIDKSTELNIEIPCIEDKGKEYLKYMNVNKCNNDALDIGNGNDHHQNSKKQFTLLNKGNKLTGNIRGGRVRGRTQTRILAALPTELINNSNNKSPPLKRVKNDVEKEKAQRRKSSQLKYQRNNYLKLGSKEVTGNSKRPTVKELRALMLAEDESAQGLSGQKEECENNIVSNATDEIIVVDDVEFNAEEDEEKVEGKDEDKEIVSDNEEELVPIYNTHCVLLNDDTIEENGVEKDNDDMNKVEYADDTVAEYSTIDNNNVPVEDDFDNSSSYEGKYQEDHSEDDTTTQQEEDANNDLSDNDDDDDDLDSMEEDEKDASTFSRTLTFRGVDYKVL